MKTIETLRAFLSKSPSVVYPDEVLGYVDAIERELEERYVEKPTDKNGVPIHIGDVLQGERCSGGWCEPFKVIRMEMDKGGWTVYELGGYNHTPNLCRHKPPTVEDVLREFLFDACGDSTPEEAVVKRFAERLRLREED